MDGSDIYVNQNNYVDGAVKPAGAFIGQKLLATNGNTWEWSGTAWFQRKIIADYFTEVAAGNIPGSSIMSAMGERESMGTTATGEDIWRGSATSIPIPVDAGEQMEVVSSDVADTPGSTGARTLRIHYIDASGAEQLEDVTMNGATGVALTETNVRFVQDMYTLTVGSNGVAEGNITIYKQGAVTTIYNMIALGGNKSLIPHRMVPFGKTLYLKGWHLTEAQGKRVTFRIRSTDMYGVLIPGVFCFKDVEYLKASTSGMLELNVKIPALSIVTEYQKPYPFAIRQPRGNPSISE